MRKCKGMNCGATTGPHSRECLAEHAAAVAGGRFVKAGAPQPPSVGSIPEGWMLVERGFWTEEQAEAAGKTITLLKDLPGMTDRTLGLSAADAAQCKAPDVTLADFLPPSVGAEVEIFKAGVHYPGKYLTYEKDVVLLEDHRTCLTARDQQIAELQARVDRLEGAMNQLADWPDGGDRYGQNNMKRFAAQALAQQMNNHGE